MTAKSFRRFRGITTTNWNLPDNPEKQSSAGSAYSHSDEFVDQRLSGDSSSPTLKNATYIGVQDEEFQREASSDQIEDYERLELYNRGTHNGKWRINQTQLHDQDDWYFCRAMTGQMGLSDRERLLTWNVFKSLDMRSYRTIEPSDPTYTRKQYLVAFCVAVLIYNSEQSEDGLTYYPGTESESNAKGYGCPKVFLQVQRVEADLIDRHQAIERCAERLGFSDEELRSCLEIVRPNLPAWIDDC